MLFFVCFVAYLISGGDERIWTREMISSTFSYGNHISTSITKARSTGDIRERAFAF